MGTEWFKSKGKVIEFLLVLFEVCSELLNAESYWLGKMNSKETRYGVTI